MQNRNYFQFMVAAPADAGKTTLTESLLYVSGVIPERGRVDKGTAFLDTDALERKRGITIYSKCARFEHAGTKVTLIDTPGHADFTPEAERALMVSDAVVLVINASDGVTDRVKELFLLTASYEVPLFFFINKCDLPGSDANHVLSELKEAFSAACVRFDGSPETAEEIALLEETLLNAYLNTGVMSEKNITELIRSRRLFPVFSGSALHGDGVPELLDAMLQYHCPPAYAKDFAARVYKIERDTRGARLSLMKVTGGTLKVRDSVTDGDGSPAKITQIRLYNGSSYEEVQEVPAGELCAVTGLKASFAGQGLGTLSGSVREPIAKPLTICRVVPANGDLFALHNALLALTEEEPSLSARFTPDKRNILINLAGRMQADALLYTLKERYGTAVTLQGYQESSDDTDLSSEELLFQTEEEALAERMAQYEAYVEEAYKKAEAVAKGASANSQASDPNARELSNDEVKAIYEHTYGPIKKKYDPAAAGGTSPANTNDQTNTETDQPDAPDSTVGGHAARTKSIPAERYLLVDGYNVIHANDELKALAADDLKAARDALIDILINFSGFRPEHVVLVFDAYRVPGGAERIETVHNISVVYTRTAETADQYIEKTAKELKKHYHVTVATSDALEQIIIFGAGADRWSAADFWNEIAAVREKITARAAHLSRASRTTS